MKAYEALVVWVYPIVCLGGLSLNLVCAVLFHRLSKTSKQPSSKIAGLGILLTGLCCFDALQLLLSLLVIVLPEMERVVGPRRGLHQLGAYSIRCLYPLLMSANYASIWTICAICAIRYAAVCHPLASRHKCQLLRRHRTILTLIATSAIALNVPRFFEFTLIPAAEPFGHLQVDLDLSPLRRSRLYLIVNDGLLYPSFVYLLPLLILSSLYAHIYQAMHRAPQYPRQPRLSAVSVISWRGGDTTAIAASSADLRGNPDGSLESRSGLMLATIVVLFFACHSLAVSLRWWELADPRLTSADPPNATYQLLTLISNIGVLANSSANPFVYFFFTPLFRQLTAPFKRQRAPHRMSQSLLPSAAVALPLLPSSLSQISFNHDRLGKK